MIPVIKNFNKNNVDAKKLNDLLDTEVESLDELLELLKSLTDEETMVLEVMRKENEEKRQGIQLTRKPD